MKTLFKTSQNTIDKLFMSTLGTMVLAEIAHSCSALIDAICISLYLGDMATAAFGLVSPIVMIVSLLAGILGTGAQNICAKKLGSVKPDEANCVFMLSVIAGTILSLALFAICRFCPDFVLMIFGASKCSDEVVLLAKEYLFGYMYGFFPLMICIIAIRLVQLDGGRKLVRVCSISQMTSNIVFNLLNAFVIKGGMFGMALATALGCCVEFLVMSLHFFKKDKIFKLSLRHIKLSYLTEIMSIGMPVAARRFANIVKSICMNRIILSVASTAGLVALSVQGKIKDFGDSVGTGIGLTVLLLAGILIGEKDKKGIKDLFVRGLKSQTITSIIGVCLIFTSSLVARLFVGDSDNINIVAFALVCYAISIPLVAINIMYVSYLNGIGKKVLSSVFSFLGRAGLILVTAFIMTRLFGTVGLFISYPLSELLMIFTALGYVAVKKRTLRLRIEDVLLLPEDFGYSEDQEFSCAITSVEEAVAASERTRQFCLSRGVEAKKAYHTSLAMEEMAVNIIQHAFGDGKKHCVDVRVIVTDDSTILRVRDDCAKFDPKEYLKLHERHREDPTSCIGLRLMFAGSKSVDYVNSMNMNNLIIEK